MRTTTTRARVTRAVGAAAFAAVLLTGCASGADDGATDTAADDEMGATDDGADDLGGRATEDVAGPAGDEEAAGDSDGSEAAGGVDEVVTFGQAVAAGRELARTATITLEVADVDEVARAVTTAAARVGGFVQTADVQGGDFGSARLTLRVPATELDPTLVALGDLGLRVVSSGVSTDDLTDQLVDLGARIRNLETLEIELQELLTSVENSDANASQLLTVYDRINGVRAQIEQLEAQRGAAADRVALATIHVDLVAQAVAPELVEPEPQDTLARAWQTTVDAFVVIRDALIWLVVTILPVALAVIGLPALVLWALVRTARQRRRPRGDGDGPTPGSTPPTPTAPEAQERTAATIATGAPQERDQDG